MFLFFDTETTGLSRNSDHVVQIAWILTNQHGDVVTEESHVIRPSGYSIPPSAVQIHGISTAYALDKGKPLKWVLERLTADAALALAAIAHNLSFDLGILQTDYTKAGLDFPFHRMTQICTMKLSTIWCRIQKLNGSPGFKFPKLQELHYRLFGHSFDNAHDALADTHACMRCYFELIKIGVIAKPQFVEGNVAFHTHVQQPKDEPSETEINSYSRSPEFLIELERKIAALEKKVARRDQRIFDLTNQISVLKEKHAETQKTTSSHAKSIKSVNPSVANASPSSSSKNTSANAETVSRKIAPTNYKTTLEEAPFPFWLTNVKRRRLESNGYQLLMSNGDLVCVSRGGQRIRIFKSIELDQLIEAFSSNIRPRIDDAIKKRVPKGKAFFPSWLTIRKRRFLEERGCSFLEGDGNQLCVSMWGQRIRLFESIHLDQLIETVKRKQIKADKHHQIHWESKPNEPNLDTVTRSAEHNVTFKPWVIDKNNLTISNRNTGATYPLSTLTFVAAPTPGFESISHRLWIRQYDIDDDD